MKRAPGDMTALARRLASAADELLLAVKGMDDLGWTTDSYSRSHLRDVASCLQVSATRIASLQGGTDLRDETTGRAP
ncbi:hypothetical protein [Embleya sp. MST-111070]|uniref:hypothetical protein n=1 Tax=Embleya sp. MST-111070 TaxID=3398231 RepID=UPI003F736C02